MTVTPRRRAPHHCRRPGRPRRSPTITPNGQRGGRRPAAGRRAARRRRCAPAHRQPRPRYSHPAARGAPWCLPGPMGPHQRGAPEGTPKGPRPAGPRQMGHARGAMPEGTAMTGVTEPSYSHGASEVPLLGETIGANLRRVAAVYPDREAVVDVPTGRRWTYARFAADTDALARGLIAEGIEAGERVGIWAPNCPEWVLLQYATAKAGIVLVNINPAYRSGEVGYALRQSGV